MCFGTDFAPSLSPPLSLSPRALLINSSSIVEKERGNLTKETIGLSTRGSRAHRIECRERDYFHFTSLSFHRLNDNAASANRCRIETKTLRGHKWRINYFSAILLLLLRLSLFHIIHVTSLRIPSLGLTELSALPPSSSAVDDHLSLSIAKPLGCLSSNRSSRHDKVNRGPLLRGLEGHVVSLRTLWTLHNTTYLCIDYVGFNNIPLRKARREKRREFSKPSTASIQSLTIHIIIHSCLHCSHNLY